ncbi:MAG: hypothetical protein JW941_11170 [Candidatus Coatesbacteria bacterium]|nr:hypothetical protein [Candidatus Coatesbacteria bacterium]
MVEAVSLQTSFAQTVAAEKVTHVQAHHGENSQQLFAAELAKQDDQRLHEVLKMEETEQEQGVDDREERKKRDREGARADSESRDEASENDLFPADESEHLIDITI